MAGTTKGCAPLAFSSCTAARAISAMRATPRLPMPTAMRIPGCTRPSSLRSSRATAAATGSSRGARSFCATRRHLGRGKSRPPAITSNEDMAQVLRKGSPAIVVPRGPSVFALPAQVGLAHLGVLEELRGGPCERDAAPFEDVAAARDAERHARILLHDQHGSAE